MGLFKFFCIKAEIKDESTPPDKKQPTGTSDINLAFTDFTSSSSIKFSISDCFKGLLSLDLFAFSSVDQ